MFNRYVSLVARLCLVASFCLALGITAFGQSSGYLFQLPGANVPGSRFFAFVYDSNPFSPLVDKSGPLSATQVLAKPDGTKFYFIGTGSGGVQSIDSGFNTFRSVNGILPNTSGTITAAAMTPDGKYLLVGGADLYIVDTATDTVLANTANITGANITGFAISRDSKTAWVLTNSAAFPSQVIAVNLTNRQRLFSQAYSLPFGGATSIALSPLGLLYVALINRIYEIDPATLNQTSVVATNCLGLPVPCSEIQITATPGNMHFTPDGTTMFFVNLTPNTGGQSINKLTLAGHNIATWPPYTGNPPPVFDDVYVVSNSRVFAFSSATTTLWDITPAPLGGVVSQLSAIVPVQNILAVAISNELPSARFLYLLIGNGNQTNIARVDLASNTLSIQGSDILNTGIFTFVAVPPQSGAASFLVYNNLQLIKANTTPLPLIARVLDSTGRPLNNIAVTFQTDAANGITIATPVQVSNGDGYVQTAVTVPNVPGTYTVTLTAGGATTTYSLTVPGVGVGGLPGTIPQVTIFRGDGQLIEAFPASLSTGLDGVPLTIRVTDANGKPLDNVPVTFAITNGIGNLVNTDGATHQLLADDGTTVLADGIAFTDFEATSAPSFGQSFQSITVNASTSVGSVDFSVVIYALPADGVTAQPQVDLLVPSLETNRTVIAGQGQSLPNAIQAAIHASNLSQAPIPGVGIRIASRTDPRKDGPATCVGSSLSDNTGVASCTIVAACQIGTFPMEITIGEYRSFDAVIQIGKGQASVLAITSGNNQSGKAGDTLGQTLYATVSDPCGGQVLGVTGTWTVISGSATLKSATSVSDSAGRFSTQVVLGQVPGPVQIRLAVPNVGSVTFNLNNNVVIAIVALISGSGQTGFTSAAFPQPVVFQVRDAAGNPLPGVSVAFNLVSGSGSVNPSTLNTDAQGRVATTITAGTTAGSITISASAGGLTTTASVTSVPPGVPLTPTSFFNAAADSVTGAKQIGLVPCGLASAQANGLAPGITGSVSGATLFGPLQYNLNGLSISINGAPVPILSLSNINGVQQVNFQTPCETPVGSATVVLQLNGGTTTVAGVQVLQAQPGIFNFSGSIFNNPSSNGKTYGAIYSATDGSLISPSNPARRGGSYYMFATGLGLTNPPALTNASGTGNQAVAGQIALGINNAGVPVNSAFYSVGYVGIYTITFTIPPSATPGTDQVVALAIGGVFGNQVLIPAVI